MPLANGLIPADAAMLPIPETELVVFLLNDCPPWQKLNPALSLGGDNPAQDQATAGELHEAASGGQCPPMFRPLASVDTGGQRPRRE
ncbi:MAG: hypothetical protein R2853_12130 [Thermomicrobiales bacterium]